MDILSKARDKFWPKALAAAINDSVTFQRFVTMSMLQGCSCAGLRRLSCS